MNFFEFKDAPPTRKPFIALMSKYDEFSARGFN